MVKWKPGYDDVLGPELHLLGVASDLFAHRPVGQEHALLQSGRARAVLEKRNLIRAAGRGVEVLGHALRLGWRHCC